MWQMEKSSGNNEEENKPSSETFPVRWGKGWLCLETKAAQAEFARQQAEKQESSGNSVDLQLSKGVEV